MCDIDKDGEVTEEELVTSQRLGDSTKEAEKELFAEIERFRAADENKDEVATICKILFDFVCSETDQRRVLRIFVPAELRKDKVPLHERNDGAHGR